MNHMNLFLNYCLNALLKTLCSIRFGYLRDSYRSALFVLIRHRSFDLFQSITLFLGFGRTLGPCQFEDTCKILYMSNILNIMNQ